MQNLKTLLELLLNNQFDFVLVGGFAGVVHGSNLVTQDLDICMSLTTDEITKLRKILSDYHPKHRMNPNFQPDFIDYPKDISNINNIYLITDLGILDIMNSQPPVGDFDRIKKDAIEIKIFGHTCKVISIEDLLTVKKSMKRPKDIETSKILEKIKNLKTNPSA